MPHRLNHYRRASPKNTHTHRQKEGGIETKSKMDRRRQKHMRSCTKSGDNATGSETRDDFSFPALMSKCIFTSLRSQSEGGEKESSDRNGADERLKQCVQSISARSGTRPLKHTFNPLFFNHICSISQSLKVEMDESTSEA